MGKTVGHRDADELERRVISVVRSHQILFGSSLSGPGTGIQNDYESLLDFYGNPSADKIRRLKSVLHAHEILFSAGFLERDGESEAEIPLLIRFLSTLAEETGAPEKRSAVLPGSLGTSFIRKRLGVPLFGMHRPQEVPAAAGLLFCHRSIAAGGAARLSAVLTGPDTSIRYKGLGIELDSSAPWLHCAIAAAGDDPVLRPAAAFSRKPPTTWDTGQYTVHLAQGKVRTLLRAQYWDPFEYRYAYFFFRGPSERANVGRFLRDLLGGMYGMAGRDAEAVAALFIERSF